MSYIIVWRANHRDPFVDVDDRGFIEDYNEYEDAKESAEKIEKTENEYSQSQWYFNYKIYKEC